MQERLYKQIHGYAVQLMAAADDGNEELFGRLFAQLEALCEGHRDSDNDHPAQWEALADFTEDAELALARYQHALEVATRLETRDYISSINYNWAVLLREMGREDEAVERCKSAAVSAKGSSDKQLNADIRAFLK
ncbi:tetratricopeptide repeat protein [Umboniibacter marinipuniceus]|uniref:Tetratricopeptide repeat protein n=1 Tax=Umboniibacter marinipuniceus TaxID=569599 RepID=A0A3M0A8L9_9GAMM|nr:tetratricopeptide repeat protein [Umboniibacter marinipuniceus]RMA78755.1 hypothetical protein DFR27_2093 [Umboniibacter marinipuniceus]